MDARGSSTLKIEQAGGSSTCAPVPIVAGQVVRGELTANSCRRPDPQHAPATQQVDRYRFSARAGDHIGTRFISGNNLVISLSLLDGEPGRERFRSNELYYDIRGQFTEAPQDGEYLLEVWGQFELPQAAYTFQLLVQPAVCQPTLSATRQNFSSAGGTGTVEVSTGTGCASTVVSLDDWITVPSGESVTGSGVVNFNVAANRTNQQRTGTLLVGDQRLTIVQTTAASSCLPAPITPGQLANGTLSSAKCGGTESHSFQASAGQQVQISINASAVVSLVLYDSKGVLIAAANNFNEFGPVTRIIGENGLVTLPATGTYVIVVNGIGSQTISYALALTLVGAGCSFGASVAQQNFEAAGGVSSFSVTTGASCDWTASADVDWLSFDTTPAGVGNRTISFIVAPNATLAARQGNLFIAGRRFEIVQAGGGGTYAINPILPGVIADRLTLSDCLNPTNVFGSSIEHIKRYSFNGAAGDQLNLLLSRPLSGAIGLTARLIDPRGVVLAFTTEGRIPARGDGYTLPLAGRYLIEVVAYDFFERLDFTLAFALAPASCAYGVMPARQGFEVAGGSGELAVTAPGACSWVARSDASWITLNSGQSGTGGGTISYTVAPNNGATARTGTIFVAGRSIVIEQAGVGGSCGVRPIARGETITGVLGASDCTSAKQGSIVTYADRYVLQGTAGEHVIFGLRGGCCSSLVLTLYDPNGEVIASSYLQRIPVGIGDFVLPLTGDYVIAVSSTVPSGYTLTFNANANCAYTVTPRELFVGSAGGKATVAVNTAASCEWQAGPNTFWLSVSSNQQLGAGSANIELNVQPNSGPARSTRLLVAGQFITITQTGAQTNGLLNLNAASFDNSEFAPGSIVSAFGRVLATSFQSAATPVASLGGTTVNVRDSAGVTRAALLWFVAPYQVEYLLPAETAIGPATVTITNSAGATSTEVIQIATVAPGLFAANGAGSGPPLGYVVRVKANGARSIEPLVVFDPQRNATAPVAIDLGPPGEKVMLVLFGTGLRGRSALEAVNVLIGQEVVPVSFAGPQGEMLGLDQINLELPRALAGSGEVELFLVVDGKSANPLRLLIK